MQISELDYDLPEESIAQHPVPRGQSRLLVLDAEGEERHRRIEDLPALLRPDDLLVVNDTRVIPARLYARRKPGGGRVELLLIERRDDHHWLALARPAKKARPGTVLVLGETSPTGDPGESPPLLATVLAEGEAGRRELELSEPLEPHLERLGHIPLPPYIRRRDQPEDRERYQTVYARHPGAVAAPTAGLHLSRDLLLRLEQRGIRRAPVTLHVGIGTFRPVSAEHLEDHEMDGERYSIPEATAAAIRATRRQGGRVVAVGTTVVRTLETAARAAEPVAAGEGVSHLFITPGFDFRVVDVLLTNFHLPRSTLLALVSAFGGHQRILAAYREAVREGYRFYSYGDAMLLQRTAKR